MRLLFRAAAGLLLAGLASSAAGLAEPGGPAEPARDQAAGPARRVVSLNPSLTAIVLALDSGPALVGVDAYSARQRPELAELPVVGGLYNPSLEGILALEPDLVAVVPNATQRDLLDRLRSLGIAVMELPNHTLDELLSSIELLGAKLGRGAAATVRVASIRKAWSDAEARHAGSERPRAVFVLQRDPLYVVGAGSYLHDMLRVAGADNAAAEFGEAYPRVGLEWLIAARPDVLLDSSDDPVAAAIYWARWPSLPAVKAGRVVAIDEKRVTLPGPWLDESLGVLEGSLHGDGSAR